MSQKVFPFEIEIIRRKAFIKGSYSENSNQYQGFEILAINNVLVSDILNKMIQHISGERTEFRTNFAVMKIVEYIEVFYEWFGFFDVVLKNPRTNEIVTKEIEPAFPHIVTRYYC